MHKYLILLALSGILSSCFKERIEVNYNTDGNKKVVITAWLTSLDEPQFVEISRTVNYLGALTEDKVSEAEVMVSDDTMTYVLEEKEAGHYYLPDSWMARVGDVYELAVRYDGQEYTASHKMRPCPDLDNVDYQLIEDLEEGDSLYIYEAVFGFQEIAGEGDAYYGVDYPKGSPAKDSLTIGGFADDRFVDGQYFADITLSGYSYKMGDTAVVDFYSIGLETAEYLQDIENEIYRGSPFDAPPANVRTNIEGGAIGYFIVSDARREEIIIQ